MLTSCMSFYSRLVRLEVEKQIIRHHRNKFLFQIGSIRSRLNRESFSTEGKFLFQIGSIRSFVARIRAERVPRFYSRLVRLEELDEFGVA